MIRSRLFVLFTRQYINRSKPSSLLRRLDALALRTARWATKEQHEPNRHQSTISIQNHSSIHSMHTHSNLHIERTSIRWNEQKVSPFILFGKVEWFRIRIFEFILVFYMNLHSLLCLFSLSFVSAVSSAHSLGLAAPGSRSPTETGDPLLNARCLAENVCNSYADG